MDTAERLRKAVEAKKYLVVLTTTVSSVLASLDNIMKKPHSRERDRQIANITNLLDLTNDRALHFGLGISFTSKRWKVLHKRES